MRAISLLLLFFQSDPLTEGLAQFHRGDYASAEKSLTAALSPRDDARARAFLALTRAATGRCALAEGELSAQFQSTTDNEVRRLAGLGLVQCRVSQSRFDDALAIAARLKSLYPSDADVLYQTARLYMRAWNDTLYEIYRKTPASFRVNQLSGEIFETQGNHTAAIAEYRKAIEKNPKALNLHFRLGRAMLMESHSPEALARALPEFEAELALNPHDAAAEYQIGQILLAQQKPDAAAPRFARAIDLNPEFPEPLIALGKLRLDAKRHAEAIGLLERAVRLLPKSEAARYSLMMAYRNAGRTGDAQREKAELEKLQKPPEGEFTDFLKKLGETGKK
jgi:tetratricopeptide (TPR) repeat protein